MVIVKDSLQITAKFDRSTVPKNADTDAVLMVSLEALCGDVEGPRHGIQCVIVLDCSASMADSKKLQLGKDTIKFLCNEVLSEQDYLGLVTFDSEVRTVFPCEPMTVANKQRLIQALGTVKAASHTNLSGGLFQGLNVLRALPQADDSVSAVLIISDGEATSGVTDRPKLSRMAKNIVEGFTGAKPTIHSFGYGASYDPVLVDISNNTGGTFYHVPSVEHIPLAFADAMGGLLSMAAQNVSIDITVSGSEVQFVKSEITRFQMVSASPSQCTLQVRDIYLGERKDILVRLLVPAAATTGPGLIDCQLCMTYMDVIKETHVTGVAFTQMKRVMDSTTEEDVGENTDVSLQMLRVEGALVLKRATEVAESGDIGQSRQLIERTISSMVGKMQKMRVSEESEPMIREVLSDLRSQQVALERSPTVESYSASGVGQHMRSAAWAHSQQRSNMPSSAARVHYETSMKSHLTKKAKSSFDHFGL